jgi:archaellum component FlaG (FlaF/FlaG flagellin family)
MKKFLLAATALSLSATAAWAIDDDRHETRISAAHGTRIIVADDGPVVEVRGADGERTIHVERDGEDSTINVNGQEIIIRDGTVFVDGQAIESAGHSVVIVEGDEVRVIDGEGAAAFGAGFAMHMGERAEHMARLHEEMSELHEMHVVVDVEGIEAEAMMALESALAGLSVEAHFDGDDWDDLSDEERAEVRAELEQAREEVREAMHEVRNELRASGREMRNEQRRMRVEMRHAARDAAHAERDAARAEREHRRMRWQEAGDGDHERREIRIEEDEDGNRQVWINGELADDADVMAFGGPGEGMRWHSADGNMEMREVRVEEDDDGNRRVWINGEEMDDAEVMAFGDHARVRRMHGEHGEMDVRNIRVEEGDDGNRRVWINGEEVEGAHVMAMGGSAHVMRMHGEHDDVESREVRVEVDEDGNRQVWINGELAEDGDAVFMERHGNVMRWTGDGEGRHVEHAMRENVRVEQDEDGRRRIWVDDEEQTGDDLIEWLNRLESQRLAGGPSTDGEQSIRRRVMRFEAEDGTVHETEMGGQRRVFVIRTDDADGEFEFEVEED